MTNETLAYSRFGYHYQITRIVEKNTGENPLFRYELNFIGFLELKIVSDNMEDLIKYAEIYLNNDFSIRAKTILDFRKTCDFDEEGDPLGEPEALAIPAAYTGLTEEELMSQPGDLPIIFLKNEAEDLFRDLLTIDYWG